MSLFAGLACKSILKVAVYEPPLSINGSAPTQWLPRYRREIEQGELTDALVTALTGMQLAPALFRWLPRFSLVPLLKWANADDAKNVKDGFVSITQLIPTLKMDAPLVLETENRWQARESLRANVLLLGGNQSPAYLQQAMDALQQTLLSARRIQLRGLDHLGPLVKAVRNA